MQELANCSQCGDVFVKQLRSICLACYKKEEDAFNIVYQFLKIQKNREATIQEIVEATNVEEELIIKFVKEKRLRPSEFPKLAYPCEQCGEPITTGKLCVNCSDQLRRELDLHEQIEQKTERRLKDEQNKSVYFSIDTNKNK